MNRITLWWKRRKFLKELKGKHVSFRVPVTGANLPVGVQIIYNTGEEWCSHDPDTIIRNLTDAIRHEHPMFRQGWLDTFDPEHIVWDEKARKQILEAPYPR